MFWDDLDTNDGSANDAGDIYFQEMPDRVIFQYEGVTRDADDKTATNTFQAVLHGDGGIDIRYKELNGFLEQATVGIENPEGDGGIEVVHNAPYLEENLALKFQPVPVTFVTVSPLSGTTPVAGVSTLAVTFDSTDMKPGVYTAAIEIAHNGTGTTPWTIPAVLEVLNQPAAITLTEPSNESWFWLGEGVSLRALATDTDYGLERVEFFADDQFLDSDATASYQEYWVPTEQGVYDLTARAIDRFDTVTVSDPVQIRVLEDVDGDQMPDDWEIANFGDTAREASADADGDGFPNIFEYHFGTDPNESTSHPEFSDEQEFVSPDPRVGSIRYFLVDGVSDTEFRKSSIRNAVSAADDFDIIEVGPGFYPGTLNLYDWVYLFSSEGARTTTIDGDGANDNVAYISENVVLEGFTLQNGYRSSDGAGLYILGSYSRNIQPRIIGCVIRNNRAGDEGGGAYIRYAHPVFINCTLADNTATTGNGIHLSGTQSDVTLINTLLSNPGQLEISGSGIITSQHSLVRDPATGNLFLDGVDMGTSDPGLGFDLGLTAQSIARDAGTGSLHARIDADGEDYSDSAPDIGADEFHDADGDGLPDWIEMQGITEATEDTDGDTLGNLAEYATHGTDPRNGDVDDDGLDDAAEIAAGTNASKADTDGDSLPDGWEVQYGLDPLDGNTGDEDPDGDTLLNSEEFALGTDPTSDDTDGDGLKDHIESTILASLDPINFFYLSPLIADSDGDGILDGLDSDDGDGLSNLEEIAYGTDPNRADTDLDGVFDDIELDFGFDPLVANAFATDDSDLDGLTDLFEINFGTDPLDDDTNDNGMKDGEELDNGGDPINPGPPPPPLNPGVPPAPDPNLPAPDPIIPGDYDILVETVSIAQPKHGFAPYEEIDPTKRFLKQSSTQSFSGGNPESGPLNVNGSKTISIDLLTGDSETTGDSFVNTGGDPQSPTRKSGSHEIGSYDDPPNQETDHDATLSYDSVLSDEYLTEDLITNGMSELPGYQNQFAPGTPYAYRNLHENELRFDSRKVQFKFKWHTDVTEEQRHPIKWFILFTPEDDPNTSEVDESQQIEIVGDPIEWAGDTEESPLSEIDPNSLKPDEEGVYELVSMGLYPDHDRDGIIALGDQIYASRNGADPTFRFWINDDDDSGEVGNDDVPGEGAPDAGNDTVDGLRDLVDFFPVHIDIAAYLSRIDDLSKVTVALSGAPLRFILYPPESDGLSSSTAGNFLSDLEFALTLVAQPSEAIGGLPLELSPVAVQKLDEGQTIRLFEGVSASNVPLLLHVYYEGGEVFHLEMPLGLHPVEEMFHHVDLTGENSTYDGTAASPPEAPAGPRSTAPGWPDERTNERTFAFLHGYNVDAQRARGWQAEIFKRLHQLGSNARFVGVTWHGATGLDYHGAVFQAFQTGESLDAALSDYSGDLTVAAHSLGNMVVSHAIQNHNFRPNRYYMINAAVPVEAYDYVGVASTDRDDMIESKWTNLESRVYASNWHELFQNTPTDNRNQLSWKNAFFEVRELHHPAQLLLPRRRRAGTPGGRELGLGDIDDSQPRLQLQPWSVEGAGAGQRQKLVVLPGHHGFHVAHPSGLGSALSHQPRSGHTDGSATAGDSVF